MSCPNWLFILSSLSFGWLKVHCQIEYECSTFNKFSPRIIPPCSHFELPIRNVLYNYRLLWLHGNLLPPSSGFKRYQSGPRVKIIYSVVKICTQFRFPDQTLQRVLYVCSLIESKHRYEKKWVQTFFLGFFELRMRRRNLALEIRLLVVRERRPTFA